MFATMTENFIFLTDIQSIWTWLIFDKIIFFNMALLYFMLHRLAEWHVTFELQDFFWTCVPTHGGLPCYFDLSPYVVGPVVLKHFSSQWVLAKWSWWVICFSGTFDWVSVHSGTRPMNAPSKFWICTCSKIMSSRNNCASRPVPLVHCIVCPNCPCRYKYGS
jgi:hypothetical protein